jgi:uncharacterized protein (TIGR01777 family)
MRVAITGASGLIGRALQARLEVAGHQVTPVVRTATHRSAEVAWIPERGQIDAPAFEGLDAVVHLAGAGIGDRRWSPARKNVIRESRTRATALLADTLAGLDHKPAVLISASAIGYYGERGDAVLDEHEPPGHDFLADLCVQWESATAAARAAGIRVAHARSGLVLSRDGGMLPKVLPIFRLGLGGRLGSGRQWWSWISIDDEVRALEFLLDHDVDGPVNLVAPNPVTNAEFTRILAGALHRPAVLLVPAAGPKLALGREMAELLLFTSTRAEPAALLGAGFEFSDPSLGSALRRLG